MILSALQSLSQELPDRQTDHRVGSDRPTDMGNMDAWVLT
jgi:hypothetical protein